MNNSPVLEWTQSKNKLEGDQDISRNAHILVNIFCRGISAFHQSSKGGRKSRDWLSKSDKASSTPIWNICWNNPLIQVMIFDGNQGIHSWLSLIRIFAGRGNVCSNYREDWNSRKSSEISNQKEKVTDGTKQTVRIIERIT